MGHLDLVVRLSGSYTVQRRSLQRELRQGVYHGRAHGPWLVFHCTNNSNWESIRLLLSKTRDGQARSRQAIHFVYAGGETSPEGGAVILYGRDIFYCQIDYWKFYQAGLTGNGVVLSYVDVPVDFLYFGNRPPRKKGEGGKRWNKR